MRRWQAIVLAALALVAASYGGYTTTNIHAGGPQFTVSVDCDTSSGGIQNACVLPGGTTSVTADVYLTNNTGGAVTLASFDATLSAVQQFFVPLAPACSVPKKNCNPDFNDSLSGTGWACDPVLADTDLGATVADSLITCLNASLDGSIGSGATVLLFSVSYTTVDGESPLTLKTVSFFDENINELASCNPTITTSAICNDALVTIGAAVATSTSTPPPTATPAQNATATPCTGPCPTATRLAFVTVTPIVTPPAVAAATTAAGTAPPPPPPPPPAPDGTAGGAGARPIRLPDTGDGDGGGAATWIAIMAAITAVGAAGIASGAWFNARRRSEED